MGSSLKYSLPLRFLFDTSKGSVLSRCHSSLRFPGGGKEPVTSAPVSWQGGFAGAEGPSAERCQTHGNMMHFFSCSSFLFISSVATFFHRRREILQKSMRGRARPCEIDRPRDRKLGEYLDARRSSPFLTLPSRPPRLYLWSAPVSCKEQQQERTVTFGPQRGGRW